MDIDYRYANNKWIAEVWEEENDYAPPLEGFKDPYPEDVYAEVNQWCIDTLGYHARTAYHVFEFKKKSDLDWFILRWQ